MCNEAVQRVPEVLKYIPDHFVTQEMCSEAVQSEPWALRFVPDQYKTQEMFNRAVEIDPEVLYVLIILWIRNCGFKP